MRSLRFRKNIFLPSLITIALSLAATDTLALGNDYRVSIGAKYTTDKDKDGGDEVVENERTYTEIEWNSETVTGKLMLTIKNGGHEPVKGTLQWCLIAECGSRVTKSSSSSNDKVVEAEPAIFDSGSKEMTLEPGTTIEEVTFKSLESKTTNESAENLSSGNTTDTETIITQESKGYLVMFVVNGHDIASKSNSSRYLKNEWKIGCIKANQPKKESSNSSKKSRKKPTPLF